MSDLPTDREFAELRRRVINLYDTITALMLLGMALLIVYIVEIGPLTSPGAQQSFGLAVAFLFVMGSIMIHVVDRTYRAWPLGRHFRPSTPEAISPATVARFLRIFTVVAAGAAIAYLLTAGIIL